jgi:hypothetical protein
MPSTRKTLPVRDAHRMFPRLRPCPRLPPASCPTQLGGSRLGPVGAKGSLTSRWRSAAVCRTTAHPIAALICLNTPQPAARLVSVKIMTTAQTIHGLEAGLEAEFAGWQAWRGVSGLYYARRRLSSPPIVVRAGNREDLRERVKEYLASKERPLPVPRTGALQEGRAVGSPSHSRRPYDGSFPRWLAVGQVPIPRRGTRGPTGTSGAADAATPVTNGKDPGYWTLAAYPGQLPCR